LIAYFTKIRTKKEDSEKQEKEEIKEEFKISSSNVKGCRLQRIRRTYCLMMREILLNRLCEMLRCYNGQYY
jgi:hypothetical protein